MNLRHLQVFVAVVECGGVTRAAEKLYVAQPSVSQTIAELEQEYGVALFERLNRRLYLTELGNTVYTQAKRALVGFEQIEATMKDNSAAERVRIGASVTVGVCLLPEWLARIRSEGIIIETVFVGNTERVAQRITDGSLDFAVVEGETDTADLTVTTICDDALVTVGSYDCRLVDQEIDTLILRERGSGTRELAERALGARGISVKHRWEVSSTQAILNILSSVSAATVISKRLVADRLADGSLHLLMEEQFPRRFSLICHKDKRLRDTHLKIQSMLSKLQ